MKAAFATLIAGPLLGTGSVLTENSMVSVGLVLAGFSVTVSGTLYLGRKLERLNSLGERVAAGGRHMEKIEKSLGHAHKRIDAIERKLIYQAGRDAASATQPVRIVPDDN